MDSLPVAPLRKRASIRAKLLEPLFRASGIKTVTATPEAADRHLKKLELRPESFAPPRSVSKRATVKWTAGGWPSYTIGDTRSPTRLIYLHGGGYVTEIKPWHWNYAADMATRLHATTVVPLYPLAPRQTAAQTVPQLADHIAEAIEEVGADNVAVLGDSAGGGLTLSTTQHLIATGRPAPACLVLISPWLDVTMSDPDQYARRRLDRMMSIPGLVTYAERFAGDLDLRDPMVSPVFGAYDGLPPVQVITGTSDLFYVDSLKFVAAAQAAGVTVDIVLGEGLQHIFPLFPLMPEALKSRKRTEQFLRDNLRTR